MVGKKAHAVDMSERRRREPVLVFLEPIQRAGQRCGVALPRDQQHVRQRARRADTRDPERLPGDPEGQMRGERHTGQGARLEASLAVVQDPFVRKNDRLARHFPRAGLHILGVARRPDETQRPVAGVRLQHNLGLPRQDRMRGSRLALQH